MIQKIEKWRIRELEQALNRLSLLLRKGNNFDWANVFSHFAQEAQSLADHKKFNLDMLKRLTQNIVNCFDHISSLRNLVLTHENARKMDILNREFRNAIRLLFEILASIEEKLTESIN
ncbi:MAG: hypothetical protein JSV17_07495 [Candidatus Aminicenantes bacterium]|nr:MAG: hypothetical protein JSV17_07495 [Candidatus Aminicenantes bacterium]